MDSLPADSVCCEPQLPQCDQESPQQEVGHLTVEWTCAVLICGKKVHFSLDMNYVFPVQSRKGNKTTKKSN